MNDVYLVLAAGCDSVRLFQANSWIDGVGTFQGSGGMVYGGSAHGVNGTSGLLQLLEACRQGGTVTYTPSPSDHQGIFTSILDNILDDFAKPY